MINLENIVESLKRQYPEYDYEILNNKIGIWDPPGNHYKGRYHIQIAECEITEDKNYDHNFWIDFLEKCIFIHRMNKYNF
ncbi:MAG: hypothetical protein M0R77_17795 [Gammaproteobacteria bacterium]|nr:hypothetical protein [Gammaproteobacteria bacterium]